MALLAETLVEEWLNRRGFFTIRGIKEGNPEIDILAIKYGKSKPEAWHVEVQASFRPMNYISKLTKKLKEELKASAVTAKVKRDSDRLKECVKAWVNKKYEATAKAKRRNELWPGLDWKYRLVHGVVHDSAELELIADEGVELVPLAEVLNELCPATKPPFTCAAGGDLADLIKYYGKGRSLPVEPEPEGDDEENGDEK